MIPGNRCVSVAIRGTELELKACRPAYRVRFHVEVDGSGPATALDLVQPNGTFTAERKTVEKDAA